VSRERQGQRERRRREEGKQRESRRRAEEEQRKSRERDEGGQRKSRGRAEREMREGRGRGRQDDVMWREERSDDVAVDACCETKSVRGKLDLCIFNTFLCSAQLVASLLLSKIL